MPKTFRCADAGIPCAYETAAMTRRELMERVAHHIESSHGMVTLPPVLLRRIEGAVRG
jgi:predicted small metal-binding protein